MTQVLLVLLAAARKHEVRVQHFTTQTVQSTLSETSMDITQTTSQSIKILVPSPALQSIQHHALHLLSNSY